MGQEEAASRAPVGDQLTRMASNVRPLLALVGPYAVALGAIYNWAYWSKFQINIWPYMGILDIVRLSALPLAAFFIGLLGQYVIQELVGALPYGGGAQTSFARVTKPYFRQIAAAFVLISLLIGGLVESPFKWFVVAALVGGPLNVYLTEVGFLSELLEFQVRRPAIMILCIAPFAAAGVGALDAWWVQTGRAYAYLADRQIGDIAVPQTGGADSRVKYLGRVGDYIFLLGGDNITTFIMKMDTKQLLSLRHYPS